MKIEESRCNYIVEVNRLRRSLGLYNIKMPDILSGIFYGHIVV